MISEEISVFYIIILFFFKIIRNKFRSMLSSNASKDLQDYFKIKRTCTIPLKIKMLFFILESTIYPKHHEKLLNKDQVKHFKALLKSLQKQSLQEKAFFLKVNMQFLKDVLTTNQQTYNNLLNNSIISTIETPCNISETFMKVSYWAKAKFKLNKESFTINLISKKKQLKISLKQYYVRKSRKLKNTLVLESHFDQAGENQKKHVVEFKNSIIFHQIYDHLRQCIIKSTQRQILELIQPSNLESQKDLQMSKALTLLNTKAMTKYFNQKDKVLNKLTQGKIKFKHFVDFNRCKIYIGKQHGNFFCYKLERIYSLSLKELQQAINLFNPKQRGNMLCYDTIQNFSQHVQLGYFKYFLQNKVLEFLTIFQDLHNEKQLLTVIKGIDNILVAKIIDFIIVNAIQKSPQEITLTVYGKFNFEKMSSKDEENMTKAFMIDLTQLVALNKQVPVSSQTRAENQLPQENQTEFEEQFYSVRGDILDQQMDDIPECSVPFQRQENQNFFQKKNEKIDCSNETFCDLEILQKKRQESFEQCVDEQGGKSVSYSSGSSSNENQSPMLKKEEGQHPTSQSDEKDQEHLTHRWNIHPQQKSQTLALMEEHHLFKCFARCKQGGVYDIDKPVIQEQKKVFKKILAQFGQKIIRHKSIATVSLPVQIFKSETHLKTIARNFTYVPLLIDKVVKQQPLTRMKRVIQAVVAMDGLGLVNQKPFNPTLGETYQGRIDGCPVVLQQISHHPPVGSYHLQGRGYTITGQVQPKISFGVDSLKGYSDRPSKIVFEDGLTIEYKQSMMLISGMLLGERSYTFCGKTYYFDEKNNLFGQLNFGPKKFYLFKSDEQYDTISGQIYQVKQGFIDKFKKSHRKNYPQKQDIVATLAKCEGNWNQYFEFDGVETINYVKQLPCQLVDEKFALPSDSRYRTDVHELAMGKIQASQKQKQRIQEQQRYFRKLRQKRKK